MTHLSNYGSDRLAIYTFDRVIKFVKCWTNLQLLYVEPEKMADKYFKLYPEELEPVWLVSGRSPIFSLVGFFRESIVHFSESLQ